MIGWEERLQNDSFCVEWGEVQIWYRLTRVVQDTVQGP